MYTKDDNTLSQIKNLDVLSRDHWFYYSSVINISKTIEKVLVDMAGLCKIELTSDRQAEIIKQVF